MAMGAAVAIVTTSHNKHVSKPLEGKPATISQKSIAAKANLVTRSCFFLFFLSGCQWRRGFTTQNKQLFRGNGL